MTYTIELKLGTDTSSATVNDSGTLSVIEAKHTDVVASADLAEKHNVMLAVAIHLVQEVTRQRGDGPTSLDVSLPTDWDQAQVARLSEALAGSSIAEKAPPEPEAPEPEDEPRVGDMYQLPHISEAPLPEFMATRNRPAPPAAEQQRQVMAPAYEGHETAQVDSTRTMGTQPPRTVPPGGGRTLPPSDDDRGSRAGFILIGLLLLAIIGGGVYAAARARNTANDDDSTDQGTAAPSKTTTSADPPAPAGSTTPAPSPIEQGKGVVGEACEPADKPNPAIEYQVSDVPDDLDRQTLNGRNIPSIRTIDGVSSVPITEFPEFSVLPLTYEDCSIDHNGRAWWGARFEGHVVWATTLFIEPVE